MAEEKYTIVLGLTDWQDAQTILEGLPSERFKVDAFASSARELQEWAEQLEPDVVIFSPHLPGMTGELISDLFHREGKAIAAIGIFPPRSDDASVYYGFDMRKHLFEPVDGEKLRLLVDLIPDAVFEAKQARQSRDYVPLPQHMMAEVQGMVWEKRGIVFWGPSGGVGKSTLASNVAAALGILGKRKTLLVDLDMALGAMTAYQKVADTSKNLYPLVAILTAEYQRQGRARCTPDLLRRYTVCLGENLDLLLGIVRAQVAGLSEFVEDKERMQAIIESILDTAMRTYDFVVVDLGIDAHHPVHFVALRWAKDVFTIIRPNIADIRKTASAVPALRRAFGQSYGKFHLVVNQWSEEAGLSLKEIVESIPDMPLKMTIPLDRRVSYVLNQQQFLVLQREIGPAADAIVTLAAGLYSPLKITWERRGGRIIKKDKKAKKRNKVKRRKEKGLLDKAVEVLTGRV